VTTMAPEAPPAPGTGERGQPPRGRGNLFTRKLGPLPTWAWMAIGLALILGYAYYKSKTTTASSGTATGTDASQVPQFVNQTYTSVSPPSAPVAAPATASSGSSGNTHVPLKREPGGKARVGSEADLYNLAKQVGVSEQALVRANPRLRTYVGTGKGIPSGTVIKLPKGAKL
jgi:hypothetical protein